MTEEAASPLQVSILICTWRRPVQLKRALASLYDFGWRPSDTLDIITCHPPCDDESVAMIEKHFPDVSVVRSDMPNLSHQRNLAARAARGKILVYLDDDAWPRESWLDHLMAPFEEEGVAAVGGCVVDPEGRPMIARHAVTEFGRTYRLASAEKLRPGHALTLPGGNFALRRSALFDLGGFDENYRYHLDETDVCLCLAQMGFRLVYEERAVIFHESAAGPHRKTQWDRDWCTIAMNQVYFSFTHVRRARWRLAFVPWLLQLPKLARFFGWVCRGRLSPKAAFSCFLRHLRGTIAGYRKGLTCDPRRPLALSSESGERLLKSLDGN